MTDESEIQTLEALQRRVTRLEAALREIVVIAEKPDDIDFLSNLLISANRAWPVLDNHND